MIYISNQFEKKYKNGAKIVLLVSILAIPLQLITSIIISRVSAEASGTLGVIELFYNTIITFFLFGGETAVVKLLSDIEESSNKNKFVMYYIRICLLYFVIFIVVLRLLNVDIIKIILGVKNNTTIGMYLVGILIIINNVLLAYIKEKEDFLLYSIGTKIFNIATFFGALYIVFCGKSNTQLILFVSLFLGCLLLMIYIFMRNININVKEFFELWTPKQKIFKYALFLHLSTIMAFVFDKTDQIIIVNKFGIGVLGGYYLIVKIVNMVKLIPNVYNSTFYPYICKQLNKETSNQMFNNLIKRNLLIIFPITIIILMNSNLIIRILYGTEYLHYNTILQLYAVVVLISAPAMVLNNYLFALGKSKQYFFISIAAVSIQLMLMLPLMNSIGIGGLVIARAFASILTITLCKYYLKKNQFETKLSKQYYLYCFLLIILDVLINIFELKYIINVFITAILLIIFTISNRKNLMSLIKIKHVD